MSVGIRDEVWQRLDPNVGRLRHRGRVGLWLGLLAAAAVWFGADWLWQSGLVEPRLTAAYVAADVQRSGDEFRVRMTIQTRGSTRWPCWTCGIRGRPGVRGRRRLGSWPSQSLPRVAGRRHGGRLHAALPDRRL